MAAIKSEDNNGIANDGADLVTPLLSTHSLRTTSGSLELRVGRPASKDCRASAPILCIHGSNCAAIDFKHLVSALVDNGYTAYSISLRGHGQSWKLSWFWMTFFTTLDHFTDDVVAAIDYIRDQHDGRTPILIGHSFGGGILQHLLCTRRIQVPGLVLIASAPLSGGGKDIMENWAAAEAPDGYDWPWSRKYQLDTVSQVRAAFFSQECPDTVIEDWLGESRAPIESARGSLGGVLWPSGKADQVLTYIGGLSTSGRKVLLLSGEEDALVTKAMVTANADEYRAVDNSTGVVEEAVVHKSGHHILLDVGHAECSQIILDWLD